MKYLEFFAGSCHMAEAFKDIGYETFTIDIKQNAEGTVDLVIDIDELTLDMIPFKPDVVFSGTPCTTYSIAAISHHRNGQEAVSDYAKVCDRMNVKILRWIDNWGCDYFIENPRGMLRKMDFMQGLPRVTIWYCQYGDDRAKPTDIWSNNIFNPMFNMDGWMPRAECHNGNLNCHHESAPRGSATGTQGKKDNYERSLYPEEFIKDIVNTYGLIK